MNTHQIAKMEREEAKMAKREAKMAKRNAKRATPEYDSEAKRIWEMDLFGGKYEGHLNWS